MSTTTRQTDRLAKAEAKAKAQRDAGQRKLQIIRAAQRKAAKAAHHQRRLRWGTMLDHVGLLALEDETLKEVLRVAYRLVQDGRVSWRDPEFQTDAEVPAAIERLMANNVMLVLMREPDANGQGTHAGSVALGGGTPTTLPSFVPKLSPNPRLSAQEPRA